MTAPEKQMRLVIVAVVSPPVSEISPAVVKALYHLTGKRYRSLLLVGTLKRNSSSSTKASRLSAVKVQ